VRPFVRFAERGTEGRGDCQAATSPLFCISHACGLEYFLRMLRRAPLQRTKKYIAPQESAGPISPSGEEECEGGSLPNSYVHTYGHMPRTGKPIVWDSPGQQEGGVSAR